MSQYMGLTSNADDPATLQDLALLCCIPLGDGCDVMDVIARRLDAAPAGFTL